MFRGELFPFQAEAVERMLERKRLIVAYEMGLGKTVITINACEQLLEDDRVEAGLVVVPASLKYQWLKQIEKFTGGAANAMVIDGTPAQREAQYRRAQTWSEYTILNYEQVVNDWAKVSKLPRDFVVLDEATAIKSFQSKRSRRVKRLKSKYRFALTGQPVENRPEEIYSIMEWVDPDVLGRFDLFDKTFIVRNRWGAVKRYRNIPLLHTRLKEAMVRKTRLDPEVRDQLPEVTEQNHWIDFDPATRKLYAHITRDLQTDLSQAAEMGLSFDLMAHYGKRDDLGEGASKLRGMIMSKLTCLRMLCDHPDLLKVSAHAYDAKKAGVGNAGSWYAAEGLRDKGLLEPDYKPLKFKAALDLLDEVLGASERNKVVLFATFKGVLYQLAAALEHRNIRAVTFTGDMNPKERQAAKDEFDLDPKCRVFLSSDAGGYGVDLPIANYLINYDLPWSAGKLDQRNARIVRLSSEWESVTVINLLMRGSIEERQYSILEDKRLIASAVVDGKGATRQGLVLLSTGSLREFLDAA